MAQLLTLLDGIEARGRIILVGATNRPNQIDIALRRPGRLDREIHVPVPNEHDRLLILRNLLPEASKLDFGLY